MEEFRPILADRLALTMMNRRQLSAEDFETTPGGAVRLTEDGRRAGGADRRLFAGRGVVRADLGPESHVGSRPGLGIDIGERIRGSNYRLAAPNWALRGPKSGPAGAQMGPVAPWHPPVTVGED